MVAFPVTIDTVNAMSPAAFVEAFGDVAEHSPWVAERGGRDRPFRDRQSMIEAFGEAVRTATDEAKLALLRAHPDLAGRAAVAGQLQEESRREQSGAGLDRLTAEEFARFNRMNTAYRTRFGFPFILAVKGATKERILSSYAERVDREREAEFATALSEVIKIIGFRIADRVSP
jgi:OHCU decarboxylase